MFLGLGIHSMGKPSSVITSCRKNIPFSWCQGKPDKSNLLHQLHKELKYIHSSLRQEIGRCNIHRETYPLSHILTMSTVCESTQRALCKITSQANCSFPHHSPQSLRNKPEHMPWPRYMPLKSFAASEQIHVVHYIWYLQRNVILNKRWKQSVGSFSTTKRGQEAMGHKGHENNQSIPFQPHNFARWNRRIHAQHKRWCRQLKLIQPTILKSPLPYSDYLNQHKDWKQTKADAIRIQLYYKLFPS